MSPAAIEFLQILFGPLLLWGLTKLLWPLRMDPLGTRFTSAIFLRYSVSTFTGYVTAIETGAGEDARRIFGRHHARFSLDNHEGATRRVDAVNVRPQLEPGHLVSVAWLVRHRALIGDKEVGNAFYVYDHDTGVLFAEKPKVGQRNAKYGLGWMAMPLPEWFQAITALTLVGIPVLVGMSLAAQWKISRLASRGAAPLVKRMESRAASLRPNPAAAALASCAVDNCQSVA